MNIIILTKNCEKYVSGYYHHDINEAFMKKSNCYLYGEGYPGYNRNDTIQDVIAKSPFKKNNVDLVVVGTSWEIQDESVEESDPHARIVLNKLNIPKVFFLNKEYKKLRKKLQYAKKNLFDLVCTVHHNYKKWTAQTGLNFIQLPFAVNLDRFKDFNMPKEYDLGFTGALHQSHTDIRYRIKLKLFKNPVIKTNLGISAVPRRDLLKDKFKTCNIYWSEWGARNILKRVLLPLKTKWAKWEIKAVLRGELLPSRIEYPKFLNLFKVFLSTPGPINIVGTRYFECMAVKTLLFCPESEFYNDTFKEGYNCVMFKKDLANFSENLHSILDDDSERNRLINNAYHDTLSKHTYDIRIESVLKTLALSNK